MASRSILLVFLGFFCLHDASAKTYTVIVSTGYGGTTDKVSIILVGQRGQTGVHDLGGEFGWHSDRVFNINDNVDVGKITEVKIRLQKTKVYKDYWWLKQVTVMMSSSEINVFYYNKEVTYNQWNSIGTNCQPGFTRTSSGCVDIDECKDPNTCQDIATCNNNIGSYNCLCPGGYNTNYLKKCIDVNECSHGNGGCEEYCYNTAGSFHCGCRRSGYKVVDGYRCADIDECLEGKDNCDKATTTCKNHDGTFTCDCKPGYTWKDYASCQRGTCAHFNSNRDSRGKLEPARCHEQGKNKFEDQCKVVCNHGYVPEDPARTNSTCSTDQYWKPYPTYCTGRSCPLLTAPPNGWIMERCRISVVKFGDSECQYSCNDKYQLKGNYHRKCQADGTWSGTQPTCERVYTKPYINCPGDIHVTLLPGMNTSDISAQWTPATANVKNVTAVDPPGVSSSYRFPFGRTIIKWVATNEIGEQDYCVVHVVVTDAEKPKIVSCPGPIYKVTFNYPVWVDIPRPVFSDNVGVVRYQPPLIDRKQFNYGNNRLGFTAIDASGNYVDCEMFVIVGGYRCQVPPEGPPGGEWICSNFGSSRYCSRKCPKGERVFGPSGFWFCLDVDGIWKHSPIAKSVSVPDCVGYTDVNASVPCFVGTVRNATLGFNGCYECPLGTYYDNGSCVKCAEGDFQDLRGQTSCKPCPAGTSSAAGAYSCRPICPPGRYSEDGLGPFCDFCAKDTYQDKQQQTGCVACPNGTYTLHIGATFCGNSPQITKLEPGNAASVNAGGTVVLKCYSQGTPTPSVYWQYTDSGKNSKTQQQMKDKDGNPTGTQLTITNADSSDGGTYTCISANAHAGVSGLVQLTVKASSVKRSSGERTKSMPAMDNFIRAIDQCPAGFFSSDGLGPLCRVCPKNSYQDQTGQTTCKQCTSGTTTLQLAAPSSAACGVAPVITSMNTSHGNFSSSIKEVTLDCYATGSPLPLVMWRFTKDIPKEFLGLPKLEQLLDSNGKPIGTRMVIKAPTDYNTGQYECTAVNTHGQDKNSLHLQVNFRQNK